MALCKAKAQLSCHTLTVRVLLRSGRHVLQLLLLLLAAPDYILPVLQLQNAEPILHNPTDVNLLGSLLLPGRSLLHLLLPLALQLREVLALVSLVAKSPRVSALQVAQLLLAVCQALLQLFALCSLVSQVGLQLIGPYVQRSSVLHTAPDAHADMNTLG